MRSRLAHDSAPVDLGGKVKLETPTLPLESWIVDDLKPRCLNTLSVFLPGEPLGQKVGHLLLRRDVIERHLLVLQDISNEVVTNIDVLASRMESWVLGVT
ncbi:hypothetical protein MTP99_005922 [Tenebrio molitor]|nr:hypothetical protein MTP99_005922 [Tenebrio molitor]